MRIIISLFLFITNFVAFAQEKIDTVKVGTDTLIVRKYKKNGRLDTEDYLVNGKSIGTYWHSQMLGIYEIYPQFGKTKKLHGILKSYTIDKKTGTKALISEVEYKEGKKDGIAIVYYENGNKKCDCTYKDGELDGLSKVYYENGVLKNMINYTKGKVNGMAEFYYPSGIIQSKENYLNGKSEGQTILYNKQGLPTKYLNFKNNKLHGEQTEIEYDNEGNSRKHTFVYNNGKSIF